MPIIIHWFRQDLRIEDNPSLFAAAQTGEVLPVYILDDVNAGEWAMGGASRVWLYHSLVKLNESLGGRLQVFVGDPIEIIEQLTQQHQAKGVFWNRCYEPWRIARDKKIKQSLQERSIEVKSVNGSLLWEPWEVLKDDQTPYKVFTPFARKAVTVRDHTMTMPAPKMSFAYIANDTDINSLNLLPSRPWGSQILSGWSVGEQAAKERLAEFIEHGLAGYKEGRNFPARKNASALSPHLHFGEISPNQVWCAARAANCGSDGENFLTEIIWREFSYYLLYHFPALPSQNWQSKFDNFPWQSDSDSLRKWQRGMTGYPIVDAGMRQLWQTGYMHNRVRMIVGSFLVKNLLIHWTHGASWFWDCLFDADLASNSASWQWVAGSGADAAPYFRIFNPVTQGERFDNEGAYTRRYVPELQNLSDKYLFSPWTAPLDVLERAGVKLGKNYPHPIVDVSRSRKRALDAYESL